MTSLTDVCEHGSLKRKCEICERDAEIARLTKRVEELENGLRAAEQFITNGVEFGFIRMPDKSTPDSAHDTLPMIRTLLRSKANSEGGGQ